jgi:tetratricopeptide (TPR) repeat protein
LLGDSVRPADNGALMDRVSRAIAGRFVGDPECSDLLAKHALREGNVSEAEALLRRSIELAPNFEPTYLSLGTLLVQNGDLKEGNAVFWSYPGFKNASEQQRVLVANAAFEMGSVFYGAGELQLAVPLYRISASQQTGAGGEMAAHIRLELLAGNLDAALRESLNRAQRYNDTRAYRDYLGMLHALKHSDEAWSAFRELSRDLQAPHIWETALVGHHIEGKSESEVLHWAQQREFSAAGEQRSYAAVYVARFATTDRTPSPELSDELARMERPVWQLDGAQGAVVRPSLDGTRQEVLGPVLVSGMPGVLPIGQFTGSGKRQVKSDLVYFVDGYRALKSGDAAAARPLFEAASRLYDLAGEVSYMLPYYALAAGKQGDTSRVEAILARFGPDARGFDYQLARAVIDGVAGKTEIALKELALARLRRPNTDERVLITQYTYGEICAMLFAATRDTRFRDAALNWARVREKVEPWQSWSFALVASLTPDSKERQEAIAMTHYLDPKSEALTRFSQAEIDTAVAAYPGHGIFTRKAGKAGNDLSI